MSSETAAGQPATDADLVDVAALVTAYYTGHPDVAEPAQQVAFGTSGHRGSSFDTRLQRGPHRGHQPGDLRAPRARPASPARCSSAATPTALSEPAWSTALEVFAANDVTVLVDDRDRYTPTPAVSHAILRHNRGREADDAGARRRRRRHAVAQPAARRRLQVQPAGRRPRRQRHHRLGAGPGQRDPARRPDATYAGCRWPGPARRRPRRPTTTSGRTSTTCRPRSTSTRSGPRACGSAPTRWAVRASTTGRRSPSGTSSTSPSSTRWSTRRGGS